MSAQAIESLLPIFANIFLLVLTVVATAWSICGGVVAVLLTVEKVQDHRENIERKKSWAKTTYAYKYMPYREQGCLDGDAPDTPPTQHFS